MSQPDFVAALGAVFEDRPAIAQNVWDQRSFADQDDLPQKDGDDCEWIEPI